jgi:hypothetical protein
MTQFLQLWIVFLEIEMQESFTEKSWIGFGNKKVDCWTEQDEATSQTDAGQA